MMHLALIIFSLLALAFAFPAQAAAWIRSLLDCLERRRMARDREITHLESAAAAQREWAGWVARARRSMKHSGNEAKRRLLLAQALAAGERYLQEIDRPSFPHLYAETEQLSQRLRIYLSSLPRSTKKGQTIQV